MTLDQLITLQTIVNTGSFRSAAEHLHKVQSAVSHSIKTLENELGFELFDRKAYRPQLTPRGRLFLEKSQEVLNAQQTLVDFSHLLATHSEPEIRLSLTSLTPLAPVTHLLQEVQARYPHVQIRLEILNLRAPFERLQDGQADLILTEFDSREDGYEQRPVGRVLLKPMASPQLISPLPAKLTDKDLSAYTQIIVSDHATTRVSTTVSVLASAPKWNVTDFYAKKQLLTAGMGWGNMPLHLVREELKRGDLVTLPYKEEICVPLYLMRRVRSFWGPASQFIWSSLEWSDSI